MSFDPSRLRRGELIAGASALLLLALMLLLEWYGTSSSTAARIGGSVSVNGWQGLTHLRWLVLLTIALALALVVLQATRRAPAVPASMSVIVTLFGVLTVLALLYRVVINVPGSQLDSQAGAYLGLLSAIGIAYGGYESMREEGVTERDGPAEIERVTVGHSH